MNLYTDLQTWADKDNNLVNAIVEIPMGSMVKYEFNKKLNVVEVDRFFTTPMPLPYNYWLLPQTFNKDDWDPLDIILISHYPLHPGIITKAKVIGVLHMIDSWEMDDKIIAIPHKEPFLSHIDNVDNLPDHLKRQIEFFLSNYKKLEGKETKVTGWEWIDKAITLIDQCIEDFKNK